MAADLALNMIGLAIGTLSMNMALVADAVGGFTDQVLYIIMLVSQKIGVRSADSRMHFGYGRVETAGALLLSFIMTGIAITIVADALLTPARVTPEGFQFIVIIFCLIVISAKELLFRITWRAGKRQQNKLLIANAWKNRLDSLSTVVVLASALIEVFYPQMIYTQTVATILIAGFILHAAIRVGFDAIRELIDYSPSHEVAALIEEIVEQTPDVLFICDERIRTLGGALAVELCIETHPDSTIAQGAALAAAIEDKIRRKVDNVLEVNVRIRPKGFYVERLLAGDRVED